MALKIQYSGIDARGVQVLVKTSGSNADRAIALLELTAAKAELQAGSTLANNAQDAALSAAISSIDSQIAVLEAAIAAAVPVPFYQQPFTANDLSLAGVLPITHGFGSYPSSTAIYKPDGDSIDPDDVKNPTVNTTAVYLESFLPLQAGAWTVSLTK